MRKLTGIIIALALVLQNITALAEAEPCIYLNEGFGEYKTNTYTIDGYDIVGTAKIAADTQNKYLCFTGNKTALISRSFADKISGDFVLSFDVKADESAISAKFGMLNGTTKCGIASIDDGEALMPDGKRAGSVRSNRFTNVAVSYCEADQRVNVYMNGVKTVSNWKMLSSSASYSGFYIEKLSGSGSVYIDNIKLYSGTELKNIPDNTTFNKEREEDLYVEQDVGDYTYFHSMCISNRAGAYIFFQADEKTNKIICERYDYTNPEKGDRIILKKITDDDVYFDVNCTKRQEGNDPNKRYKYFMIKTDFLFTSKTMETQMFLLRDSTSATKNTDYVTSTLSGSTLSAPKGLLLKSSLKTNTWYTYTAYVNLENATVNIYLDGEQIGVNIPLDAGIKNIDKVRCCIRTGGPGELQVRNCEVTGTENPEINGAVERTSVFPDDKLFEEYLNKKDGAFHFYSKMMYSDGAKQPLSAEPAYENDEMYVACGDFNKVMKTDVTVSSGQVYNGSEAICQSYMSGDEELVPVKAAAATLGKFTLDDGYGMILADDEEFMFDMSQQKEQWYDTYYEQMMSRGAYYGEYTELTQLQQLNYYLMYDRPTPEQLKADFFAKNGDGAQHPRLIVNDDKMAWILEQAKNDEYYKSLVDGAISLADAAMNDNVTVYAFNDNMRTHTNAERFEIRVKKLAFAYLLTGDEKYAERAWKELDAVSKFPDINFSHVIDTGEWSAGLAFGYDWIYNYLNDAQRKQIAEAILRLEVRTMNRAYYAGLPSNGTAGVNSGGGIQATNAFVRWKSNYGSFVNSGVIISCLAVAEIEPEICFDTLSKALQSFEYVLMGFAPDGVWLEGPNYWRTMLSDMAYSFGSLESVMGTTYKLMEAQGIDKTCRDLIGYTSPNQRFGFGDDEPTSKLFFSFDSFSFFSKYFNQPDVAMMRKIKLDTALRMKYGNRMEAADPSILDVVYYMPDVSEEDLDTVERVNVMKGVESFVVHEDFRNPNGLFFASAGGPTTFYHDHQDSGDFTFDLNGESWAYIIGKGNYNVGDTYTRYCGRAEGHNTLTINPDAGLTMTPGTFCELTDWAESDYGAYAVYDMTELYKAAKSMKRGFYIGDEFSSITVRDEMSFKESACGYWFMHTDAEATVLDQNTIILSKNGKAITVKINVDKAEKSEVSIMPAERLPTTPALDGDNGYPNIRKIAIYFEGTQADINVRFSEIADNGYITPISEWTAPGPGGKNDLEDFSYRLFADGRECEDKGKIPVIEPGVLPQAEIIPNDPTKIVVAEPLETDSSKLRVCIRNADGAKERIYVIAYSSTGADVMNGGYDILPVSGFTVDSEPEPANIGPNMFDNDMTTRWTTYTNGSEAILDLGSVQTINAIAAAYWNGSSRVYTFNISVSDDGVNYSDAGTYKTSGSTEDYEVYRLGEVHGRYVKLTGLGNTTNDNTNIIELRVLKRK